MIYFNSEGCQQFTRVLKKDSNLRKGRLFTVYNILRVLHVLV